VASAQSYGYSGSDGDDEEYDRPDIRLSREDRVLFLNEVARLYGSDRDVRQLLTSINFPMPLMPSFTDNNALAVWSEIVRLCQNGIFPEDADAEPGDASVRALLTHAFRPYRSNPVFRRLMHKYVPEVMGQRRAPDAPPTRPPGRHENQTRPPGRPPGPGPDVDDVPHVIASIESDREVEELTELLSSYDLHPTVHWSTTRAVSFRVDASDLAVLEQQLAVGDMRFLIVPAGEPDFLYRFLFVIGPDSRRFQFADTPSHETVEDLAASVFEEYSSGVPGGAVNTVMNLVRPDGRNIRLQGSTRLHEAGVQDGDTMMAGFEGNAGAVNPVLRQDALVRVRRQMDDFALRNPGLEVEPDAGVLPTLYVLRFQQRSFAAPYEVGGEPPETFEHEVEIELGPDFPETAPRVYWLSPIFHPNVSPNYESERARERPMMRGMVCLGMLQESYLPSLDFGDLCSMLINIAAYRNYSVYLDSGTVDAAGKPVLRGNFYDGEAAAWAVRPDGQQRIAEIGGQPMAAQRALRSMFSGPGGPARRGYRNTIEAVD
jgi:hypothetical protein